MYKVLKCITVAFEPPIQIYILRQSLSTLDRVKLNLSTSNIQDLTLRTSTTIIKVLSLAGLWVAPNRSQVPYQMPYRALHYEVSQICIKFWNAIQLPLSHLFKYRSIGYTGWVRLIRTRFFFVFMQNTAIFITGKYTCVIGKIWIK